MGNIHSRWKMAESIRMTDQGLLVPDEPILPFIEGDGTGPDIWYAAVRVFEAAVEKAYRGKRRVSWLEVLAGEKSYSKTGDWLPEATLEAFREHLVGIKGPLTTPVGGGIRSLNVALRQILDLYVCLRPVRWFPGVPSPVRHPENIDMVIFRENSEDIYAGVEFAAGSPEAAKLAAFLEAEFPDAYAKIRFPNESALGIKPVSKPGTQRLVIAAIEHALAEKRRSVTLVHKGNIMKFTEGGFRDGGYQVARERYGAEEIDGGPWLVIRAGTRFPDGRQSTLDVTIKDMIADAMLQQVLTRPSEYEVLATLNLNGDYISDALAAQVGGIGIAPGGNINYKTGHAIFEATHGTAPKYAGQNKVNPSSVILSGEMMFRYMGWIEAADLVVRGVERAIADKSVTYDFHRLMDGASLVTTSGFAEAVVRRM